MISKNTIKKLIKTRKEDSHKGDNGKIIVVGGSKDYFGAPILVSSAALRVGIDLLYLIIPNYIYNPITTYSPNFIVRSYNGDHLNQSALPLIQKIGSVDALVIGNGISKNQKTLETAIKIIKSWTGVVVIDADCLNKTTLHNLPKQSILTPHFGEFKRMFGIEVPNNIEKRVDVVEKCAKAFDSTILLKGHDVDIISNGSRIEVNGTGNCGMTVGGTGDTLAGIATAFVAQKYSLFDSACLAAYVNGYAGDLAFKKYGYSLLASDLIMEIPNVLIELRKK